MYHPLARFLSVDMFAAPNSPTFHTANRYHTFRRLLITLRKQFQSPNTFFNPKRTTMQNETFTSTKIFKLLHPLSHLKWVFMIWMIVLIVQIFFFKPANPIEKTGTVIFISGIMMGFISLADITRITDKEKKFLSNPKYVNRQIKLLLSGVIVLAFISLLFFSVRFLFPTADSSFIRGFTKLGYDCLVMILGFLCLIKQVIEQANYVNNLNT